MERSYDRMSDLMTTNFYAPSSAVRSERIVLPEDEARHARSVLRASPGDEVGVVDGEGGWYRVRLTHVSGDQVIGTIVERQSRVGEPAVDVTVGIGILKKRSRLETFVEKAVELGVRRIVPLRTRRTERESIRGDRLRRIMVAAMKQCRRSRLPTLEEPQSPATLVDGTAHDRQFICHATEEAVPLQRAAGELEATSVLVLVGPEGGFFPDEVEAAREAGCTVVSLGGRRLRAETAGVVAVHSVVSGTDSGARSH